MSSNFLDNFLQKYIKSESLRLHFKQLFFFGIGAFSSFVINFGLTFLLVDFFDFKKIFAIAITSFCFYTYAFVFNSLITFKKNISSIRILKYLFVLGTAYGINLFLSYILIDKLDLYYLFAMFISMSLVMILKYLIYHYWVFAHEKGDKKMQNSKSKKQKEESEKELLQSDSPLGGLVGGQSSAGASQTKIPPEIILEIESLNDRGFGIGKIGVKKWQILNSLPGEKVKLAEYKKGRKPRGIAGEILKASEFRVKAKDEAFLSTSPWQILNLSEENRIKKQKIKKYFHEMADFELPDFDIFSPIFENSYNYRNKVEFSFYGFDETEELSLAFFKRGSSRGKIPVKNTSLIHEKMNIVASKIVQFLNQKKVVARDLKTLILRYSDYEQKVIASLFLKEKTLIFSQNEVENLLDRDLKGLAVIYSDPRSPASIVTKIQNFAGELFLTEKVADKLLNYNLFQFFQVNIKAFEEVILDLKKYLELTLPFKGGEGIFPKTLPLLDMYAGVGTIGICLSDYFKQITAVELSPESEFLATQNAIQNGLLNFLDTNLKEKYLQNFEKSKGLNLAKNLDLDLTEIKKLKEFSKFNFKEASSESSLEFIKENQSLILDPPRTGLHPDLIQKILEQKPKTIFYLSCNPQTQARDFKELKEKYQIDFYKVYNFYPHTPHSESLMILRVV